MNNLIKIILAASLLLCLLNMPYRYYQYVRIISCITFGFLAYKATEEENNNEIFIFFVLALLFQPFLKI